LASLAYRVIADRIITLDIRPNEAINESQLSKDMQMGRTPIREALSRLENDRLVVTQVRKGAFAAPVDPSDFRQVSLIRQALEPVAAGLAAENYHQGHAENLGQHLELLQSVPARALDQSELMRLHLAVHKYIYGLSMNRHLEDTLSRYAHLSVRIWLLLLERQPPLVERTLELAAILERIEANDSEHSRSLMDQHVRAFDDYLSGLR
jgi:DNA-binding GntR family transcriptional regulator